MAESVHLLAGSAPGPVAEVEDARAVAELASDRPDLWHRYLRTEDRNAETGLRVYVSIGARCGPRATCATCVEPWELYNHRLGDELGVDQERHAVLLRCRDCGALHEAFPEERETPRRLCLDEARSKFPGAI